ncbi:hypothetical protein DWQ65_07530 [Treponema phagedenis]|uniref:Endonuclease/exonuclease/phosphatase family protein n=1 Tax=Treponema phagedenis TaxID=162 RepID=A0A0B7GUW8_TREPH|nr:endonuclease/exonuclease/phosphatase family protein [Treponema phagedenis]QEJ94374.1 endonuclease/exonuclease/phosphatase family protein [Treponema phagedenis]QEK01710.1 endonuclease/exonuclease/phosphatase family protein [Treponema phagedenis]QEK06827.1 endonuclease/exonuclease/phosphatase family protein [Treponema phagedenis]QSH93810.1 hypothetical protein C5O78_01845 [Treponema phagedenis]QSH99918.1 hypothetical protein DWQ65_07530 [Treponema phagedenis]
MKIVTFNIRYDNPDDGKNAFIHRKSNIIEAINAHKPDIIGFQEVLPHVSAWLKEQFPEYYFIGHGRSENFSDEHIVLGYKKMDYQLHHFRTFWLSPTPQVPGSRYTEQSICPRICIHAIFETDRHRLFSVYNTHLDHEGVDARVKALQQIMQDIDSFSKPTLPTVLMGDFNAKPTDEELHVLKEFKIKENDKNLQLNDLTKDIQGSFHDFGNCTPEKIDYIFATPEFLLQNYSVWENKAGFLSDHYPLEVEVILV